MGLMSTTNVPYCEDIRTPHPNIGMQRDSRVSICTFCAVYDRSIFKLQDCVKKSNLKKCAICVPFVTSQCLILSTSLGRYHCNGTNIVKITQPTLIELRSISVPLAILMIVLLGSGSGCVIIITGEGTSLSIGTSEVKTSLN